MVTLKDVAKKAGVSIATVSYYINGSKNLSPKTLMKVRDAIEELNYIPNASARSLKNNTSDEIGVILPNLDDSTNSEILKGIIAQADNEGMSVNITCTYNNPRSEQEFIERYIGKNYAGIILMTCQSQNTKFFKKTLQKYDISNVFIMRLPQNISTNFLGFDNYSTMNYLTGKLLDKGYRDIAIVTGPNDFFSESESVNGYSDAFDQRGLETVSDNILYTDMSKEGAFKVTMLYLSAALPQAIITSSQTIMDGVIEACGIHNIQPGDNICLITLAEERWNESYYHPNVFHTEESAYNLGINSVKILLEENTSSQLYDKRFKLYRDNILDADINIPSPDFKPVNLDISSVHTLRIATVPLPTIRSIQALSSKFYSKYNVLLQFDFFALKDLFDLIESDTAKDSPEYDIYLSDVSWMQYFCEKNSFMDITDIFSDMSAELSAIFEKNLSNAFIDGKYYGFPVIGGTQFLFYRKDLFEDPVFQNQYQQQHHLSLRPPKTWNEFNNIARFFTAEYNPSSPTTYGTSVSTSLPEDFILELLIRLWSFEGGLFDNRNILSLNTPQNIRACENLLETLKYTSGLFQNDSTTFEMIGKGEIAMAISFTEYASVIQNSLHPEFLSKIGYSRLPGNTPANVGWHFCVSKKTQKGVYIEQLFHWLCQRQTSYYETILCGQSTMKYPHSHHELLSLYPWLELTEDGLNHCRGRIYPVRGKNGLIVPAKFEAHMYEALKNMQSGRMSVSEALSQCQSNIIKEFF